jgi:hypothetical protein
MGIGHTASEQEHAYIYISIYMEIKYRADALAAEGFVPRTGAET